MMVKANCKMMNKDTKLIVCVDDPAGFEQTGGEVNGKYLMRITQRENGQKTVYIILQPDK